MIMMSALYSTKTLNWNVIVLLHWDKSLLVSMSLHSDTLSEFWASKFLPFLLNVVCLPVASTPTFTPPMRCQNSCSNMSSRIRYTNKAYVNNNKIYATHARWAKNKHLHKHWLFSENSSWLAIFYYCLSKNCWNKWS